MLLKSLNRTKLSIPAGNIYIWRLLLIQRSKDAFISNHINRSASNDVRLKLTPGIFDYCRQAWLHPNSTVYYALQTLTSPPPKRLLHLNSTMFCFTPFFKSLTGRTLATSQSTCSIYLSSLACWYSELEACIVDVENMLVLQTYGLLVFFKTAMT